MTGWILRLNGGTGLDADVLCDRFCCSRTDTCLLPHVEDYDERLGEARCNSIRHSSFYALGFDDLFAVAAKP